MAPVEWVSILNSMEIVTHQFSRNLVDDFHFKVERVCIYLEHIVLHLGHQSQLKTFLKRMPRLM